MHTNEQKTYLLIKKNNLKKVAKKLLEKEILFQSDVEILIGKRPFKNPTNYQSFTREKDENKIEEKIQKDKWRK